MSCPVCGRVMCDHSPFERGQSHEGMMSDCFSNKESQNNHSNLHIDDSSRILEWRKVKKDFIDKWGLHNSRNFKKGERFKVIREGEISAQIKINGQEDYSIYMHHLHYYTEHDGYNN